MRFKLSFRLLWCQPGVLLQSPQRFARRQSLIDQTAQPGSGFFHGQRFHAVKPTLIASVRQESIHGKPEEVVCRPWVRPGMAR